MSIARSPRGPCSTTYGTTSPGFELITRDLLHKRHWAILPKSNIAAVFWQVFCIVLGGEAMALPHLRGLRRRAVMSQEDLAEKSGVARDTISKLETGQRGAYPSTIRKLAAGLDVEPQMLVGGVEYLEEEPAEGAPKKPKSDDKDRKIG